MITAIRSRYKRLQVKSRFNRLNKREKWFLLAGIVFVVGFLLIQGIIVPYVSARAALEQSVTRKKQEVLDIALLQQDYRQLKVLQGGIARKIEQRSQSFSLFSYLENQATAATIKDRVTYMRPSTKDFEDGFRETAVEMKLELVTLERLVDFLSRVESVENVIVTKRISIQQNSQEQGLLDVIVTIATFEKAPATLG